jgi:hypothetical protein
MIADNLPLNLPQAPPDCTCAFPLETDRHPSHHGPDCPVRAQWIEAHRRAPPAAAEPAPATSKLSPSGGSGRDSPQPTPHPAAFLGFNRVVLGPEEMAQALQYYFDRVIFRDGCSPRVAAVSQRGTNEQAEFEIRFARPADGGPGSQPAAGSRGPEASGR